MNTDGAKLFSNPFPGLRPFREDEEHLFFGREHQVDAMVNKLAERRFLGVVGTSGSGKSSLVNCGLQPALHQGRMASAGTSWRIAKFRPGTNPLGAMAGALSKEGVLFRQFQEQGLSLLDIIETTLRMSKRGLIDIVQQAALDKNVNLLVVVDQFEELFRYRQLTDHEDSTAFVKLLLELLEQSDCPIYVVLTMRSDFLGDCTQFAGLAEAINSGLYLVPRLNPDERTDAIVNPIRVQGAEIEPVLVTRLVNDVGDNPDQLSILQHALNRTWAQWEAEGDRQAPLALRHYEAIGTMARALDGHAEQAYRELATSSEDPSRRQELCRTMFQAITDKATDGRGVRRPTTLATLCSLAEATEQELADVIEVFRQPSRCFLMPPVGEALTKEKVIDISHESLMRVWDRLKQWVEQEAEAAQIYRRLAESADLYANGKASTLRDPELTIYQTWQQNRTPNRAWADRYAPGFDEAMAFLKRSVADCAAERAEQERQQRAEARREVDEANRARQAAEERQRWWKRALVVMGALTATIFAGGTFAIWQLYKTKTAMAQAYAATAKAQVGSDPFDAIIHGLAAMEQLDDDPGERIELTDILARAVTGNWLVGSMPTGQVGVTSLLVLKNGDLISGGYDGTLRRWRDGEPVRGSQTIATKQGPIRSLIELRDGVLVSGGDNGTLRWWRDGKPLAQATASEGKSVKVLIELKNGEVVSGSWDGMLRRWRNGTLIGVPIATNQGPVTSLIQLASGEVISGGWNGTIRRWRDGQPVGKEIATGLGTVWSLLELKDGRVVGGGDDGLLQIWLNGNLDQGGKPFESNQDQIEMLIQRPNGDVISGGVDGSLKIWRQGGKIDTIQTVKGGIWSLALLNNGEMISGGRDGALRRWRDDKPINVLISTEQKKVLSLIELQNGDLISGGEDGTLKQWRDGKLVDKPIRTDQGPVRSLIELRNGEVISGGENGTLRRWRDGQPLGKPIVTGQGPVRSLVELSDGVMVSGGQNGTLRWWRDGKPIDGNQTIRTGQGAVVRLVVLKNGELISGGIWEDGPDPGSILRWRRMKRIGKPISTNQGKLWSLIALANGEVVSGGANGSLRRWRNGKPIGETIYTEQAGIYNVVELGNGELISAGLDGTLQRWRNGRPFGQHIHTGHRQVWHLLALKNGELVSGDGRETLKHWGDQSEMVAAACKELREHSALLSPQTAAEKAAQQTCRRYGHLNLRQRGGD